MSPEHDRHGSQERARYNDGERKIYSALELLYHEGEIDGAMRVSGNVAGQNRWKRLLGIDFLVIRDYEGFPIESKSGLREARRHQRKGREAPAVFAHENNPQLLAERLKNLMDNRYDMWRPEYFHLFHQLLEYSFQRPDLFRNYSPLVRP